MAPSEEELKNADLNAQEVVNAWGMNAGNTDFKAEFNALFDKADRYRRAREEANFYRLRDQRETDEGVAALARETAAWQLFAEAFKAVS